MSTALGYLFLLAPVVAVIYVVWVYRKRSSERVAQSEARLADLLGTSKSAGAPARGASSRQTPTTGAASASHSSAMPPIVRHDGLLTQPEILVYYLLRAGLPDYEVFPRVSLTAVLRACGNAPGAALDIPVRAPGDLDFVVCEKSMRIVAAVQIEGQSGERDFLQRRLTDSGIRLVVVNVAALPRREQVRALICGGEQ